MDRFASRLVGVWVIGLIGWSCDDDSKPPPPPGDSPALTAGQSSPGGEPTSAGGDTGSVTTSGGTTDTGDTSDTGAFPSGSDTGSTDAIAIEGTITSRFLFEGPTLCSLRFYSAVSPMPVYEEEFEMYTAQIGFEVDAFPVSLAVLERELGADLAYESGYLGVFCDADGDGTIDLDVGGFYPGPGLEMIPVFLPASDLEFDVISLQ